ncbi:rhodanese-like domain-containing protein [Bacteroidota bacterium]
MKRPNLFAIAMIIVVLGVLLGAAALRKNEKYAFKLTAQEMHTKITSESHIISTQEIIKEIESGNTNMVLVDLRTPREFIGEHIEAAINIPYERILDEDIESFFEDDRTKVLYDNNDVWSNAAWMILTQYGYENLVVMRGGLEGWNASIENKDIVQGDYPLDEAAKFDYTNVITDVK